MVPEPNAMANDATSSAKRDESKDTDNPSSRKLIEKKRRPTNDRNPDNDPLMSLIIKFIDNIELSETHKICKCEWIEVDAATGRKRLNNTSFECPMHTREGLIHGFIKEYGESLIPIIAGISNEDMEAAKQVLIDIIEEVKQKASDIASGYGPMG